MNSEEREIIIQIRNLQKEYQVGQYGYGTLTADLQSWWARIHGREDPNSVIGTQGKSVPRNRFLALDDINLDIYKGDTIGIIGSNGAGKSTLLKLLSRITAPTAGTISYNGRISSMLEVGTGFYGEMTGRENIHMNGNILGMSKAEVDSKMEDIIAFSECERFIDTPVKRYSSGMYVKLAFAVAAHLDSEILIMDEVLAVGDMKFQKKCINKMRELAREDHRTVLYVSHNMDTIRDLCNRCIVINKGKLVYDGDVESAIRTYNDNGIDLSTQIDFTNASRRATTLRGTMNTLQFFGKNSNHYDYGEKAIFKLTWTPKESNCEYFFRVLIYDINQKQLGMSVCSLSKNPTINTTYCHLLEFNMDLLSEGKYLLNFELLNKIATGQKFTCDWPANMVEIEIGHCPNEEDIWDKVNWGDIRFTPIQVLHECDAGKSR